jgi:hypothetical protein
LKMFMVICSLEECLRTVICALYETSQEIYIFAAQVSCRLRDDVLGCMYLRILCFVRLQWDQRLTLWYIGKRKQGFLRNHAIPQLTFLTPVGNRGITPCVCVKEPSRSRGVIPTAGGLSVHKGTVCCRHIRRHIQRYWILRRLCRSRSCSAYRQYDRRE